MRKTEHKCSVKNCKLFNRIGKKNEHFFKCVKLNERRKRRLKALNVSSVTPSKTENIFFWEEHFGDNFFTSTEKKKTT